MSSMRTWPTAALLAVELLKVRKRWMPYILLLATVALLAIHIFLSGYLAWRTTDDFQFQQESLRFFALPWSLPALLDTTQYWGAILIGIVAASMVATEHGWGTVRQALIRGQTRSGYLTTKLLGIAVLGSIGFLLAFGVGLGFSIIASALADRPITLDLPSGNGPSLLDVALMILRAAYALLPYVLLAFCLAVVGRSTTLGVVGILLFVIVEAIVVGILGGVGGTAADVRGFLIGHNVVAVLAANRIGSFGHDSLAFRDTPPTSELPDPTIAALVLALYCIGFLAIAFWVFQRRDIHA